MSKPEEQRLTEDKPQLVQPDNNEESSSVKGDEQPGTSRAVAMQAGMPHDSADAGIQVLQTMENAEASQSVLGRIDPGLIELASRVAESRAGPVMINYAPKIYYHDERQYQHHDHRQYQDNRQYKQMGVSDLKNVNSTQVKEKQINPLEPNNPQATNSPCGAGASQHQDNNKGNQHIMISYSWNDSKDLTYKISDELSAAGYKVWIDKNEMKGKIYDKMYEAVDNAYLVLMFLSENYKLSENCKREGKLAADKRKRIIPIITQDNYKMDGWTDANYTNACGNKSMLTLRGHLPIKRQLLASNTAIVTMSHSKRHIKKVRKFPVQCAFDVDVD
ncbi:unnamed protein product [Clavelina lepadiformis]|uniref:TIR domain-containing protein n=1 Tax=Clavelina lepadiformis TaxID=159417 RepID=A0ABP0G6T7_CLALP